MVQVGQAKHVPYLGFITTLTEVPGVGQSWLLAAPVQGPCWGRKGMQTWSTSVSGLGHDAPTWVTQGGAPWAARGHSLCSLLTRSMQRAVPGSHAGAMDAPWKEERSEEVPKGGEECGLGEGSR